jgi:hypothetical protein
VSRKTALNLAKEKDTLKTRRVHLVLDSEQFAVFKQYLNDDGLVETDWNLTPGFRQISPARAN